MRFWSSWVARRVIGKGVGRATHAFRRGCPALVCVQAHAQAGSVGVLPAE